MRFRNAINSIFGGVKNYITSAWKEIGTYKAYFTPFGRDVYANEVVRACIRTLADHTSKANVKVLRDGGQGDMRLQRIIQYRPNMYMNGKDFLYKVRTLLEINNVAFIYILRDDYGKCTGLYPMPTATYESCDYMGQLFIKFNFLNGTSMVHNWEDLAVLRKDYNSSDIYGDDNSAILTSLDLLNVTNEGMANAIKSTSNLRGILKSTKAMLKPEDAKASKDKFVEDYLNMSNGSGIAVLDSTQEFVPISIDPKIADYRHIEELRNNIYRYYGMNEDVVCSKAIGDSWNAFYEARIEPFLIALSLELTNKIFTDRERGFYNEVVFESSRIQYATNQEKIDYVVQMFDRGFITHNDGLAVFNMAAIVDGDKRFIRKEYAEVGMLNQAQGLEDAPQPILQEPEQEKGEDKTDDNEG